MQNRLMPFYTRDRAKASVGPGREGLSTDSPRPRGRPRIGRLAKGGACR